MKYIIIGNGAAGMAAAEAIRDKDPEGEIVIYTSEDRYHYSRPRIIEYLNGTLPGEKLTIRGKEFYEKKNLRLVKPASIEAIDPLGRTVSLRGGTLDHFDRLIIATGASAFRPPVEGAELDSVFTLRTIDDADRILARCASGKKVAVLGGGLLGIETAANLAVAGMKTTIVEMFDRLLPRQLDAEAASVLQSMLEKKGLRFLLGKQALAIRKNGEASALIFRDGSSIEADIIVFSAGIVSNVELARGAGILCDRGIVVDEHMETAIPGIFAAGDAAQFGGRVYGLWPVAREQGGIAGRNAAGEEATYSGSPVSVKLKVSGIELVSLGSIEAGEGVSIVTKRGDECFKRLFLKEGRLAGAILIGDVSAFTGLQKLLKSGEIVGEPGSL
ncbi:MAG TPA: FAD-dependent oxidoreductase [Rectinemataceae bacterium]|nr:FAD-dependent oxidoreductase [Rectinemataceae bacterium]